MSKAVLVATDLRHGFGNGFELSIPHLTLEASRSTMILGPNGAGKSILLKILHGILVPQSGSVSLTFGNEATEADTRPSHAMVTQKPILLRRTALENIEFVLRARKLSKTEARERAIQFLERAQLGHLANAPARSLSGGEQQRLSIARALSLDPDLLFLDEPTASLDPNASNLVERMILEAVQSNIKIIMVTHDVMQAKRLGEDVLLLHHGKLLAQQSKDDFFNAPERQEVRDYIAGRPLLTQTAQPIRSELS